MEATTVYCYKNVIYNNIFITKNFSIAFRKKTYIIIKSCENASQRIKSFIVLSSVN